MDRNVTQYHVDEEAPVCRWDVHSWGTVRRHVHPLPEGMPCLQKSVIWGVNVLQLRYRDNLRLVLGTQRHWGVPQIPKVKQSDLENMEVRHRLLSTQVMLWPLADTTQPLFNLAHQNRKWLEDHQVKL